MGLRVAFELDEKDLRHFRLIMREIRKTAARMAPEDIVAAAEEQLAGISRSSAPGFIRDRIHKLQQMIAMLTDLEWRLPHREATRVLNALAYFAEPEDLIPDGIPGVGFLDDAIMVELVVRELRHEIEAYDDFCAYRDSARASGKRPPRVSREDWLDKRRAELQARMRRRRGKSRDADAGSSEIGLFD